MNLKILLLEDLEEDVHLVERTLKKAGISFNLRSVDTRDDYIQGLNEFKPDIVLSDHSMPQFNSAEALQICQRIARTLPFILVTGTVSEEFAVTCLKMGADDYILKANLSRLPSAIENAIKKKELEKKRKQAERTLRLQNQKLIKINKELDRFVYSVSHNLRAPLMSVLGLLNISRKELEGKDYSRMNDYFQMMEDCVYKLDETLKEIVDYSKNSRIDVAFEPVDVLALLNDSLERLKYLEGADQIKFNIHAEKPCEINSDKYRLSVILNNLISNAIKYRDKNKNSKVDITVEVAPENALIEVADNGIGIHEDFLGKIFEMFYRATDRSQGAGLGLYIVKETVEKLGGDIHAESKIDEGTFFRISLPNGPNKR